MSLSTLVPFLLGMTAAFIIGAAVAFAIFWVSYNCCRGKPRWKDRKPEVHSLKGMELSSFGRDDTDSMNDTTIDVSSLKPMDASLVRHVELDSMSSHTGEGSIWGSNLSIWGGSTGVADSTEGFGNETKETDVV